MNGITILDLSKTYIKKKIGKIKTNLIKTQKENSFQFNNDTNSISNIEQNNNSTFFDNETIGLGNLTGLSDKKSKLNNTQLNSSNKKGFAKLTELNKYKEEFGNHNEDAKENENATSKSKSQIDILLLPKERISKPSVLRREVCFDSNTKLNKSRSQFFSINQNSHSATTRTRSNIHSGSFSPFHQPSPSSSVEKLKRKLEQNYCRFLFKHKNSTVLTGTSKYEGKSGWEYLKDKCFLENNSRNLSSNLNLDFFNNTTRKYLPVQNYPNSSSRDTYSYLQQENGSCKIKNEGRQFSFKNMLALSPNEKENTNLASNKNYGLISNASFNNVNIIHLPTISTLDYQDLTPIPSRREKQHPMAEYEYNKAKSAAVLIRRLEYSYNLRSSKYYKDYEPQIIFIQRFWRNYLCDKAIQSFFNGRNQYVNSREDSQYDNDNEINNQLYEDFIATVMSVYYRNRAKYFLKKLFYNFARLACTNRVIEKINRIIRVYRRHLIWRKKRQIKIINFVSAIKQIQNKTIRKAFLLICSRLENIKLIIKIQSCTRGFFLRKTNKNLLRLCREYHPFLFYKVKYSLRLSRYKIKKFNFMVEKWKKLLYLHSKQHPDFCSKMEKILTKENTNANSLSSKLNNYFNGFMILSNYANKKYYREGLLKMIKGHRRISCKYFAFVLSIIFRRHLSEHLQQLKNICKGMEVKQRLKNVSTNSILTKKSKRESLSVARYFYKWSLQCLKQSNAIVDKIDEKKINNKILKIYLGNFVKNKGACFKEKYFNQWKQQSKIISLDKQYKAIYKKKNLKALLYKSSRRGNLTLEKYFMRWRRQLIKSMNNVQKILLEPNSQNNQTSMTRIEKIAYLVESRSIKKDPKLLKIYFNKWKNQILKFKYKIASIRIFKKSKQNKISTYPINKDQVTLFKMSTLVFQPEINRIILHNIEKNFLLKMANFPKTKFLRNFFNQQLNPMFKYSFEKWKNFTSLLKSLSIPPDSHFKIKTVKRKISQRNSLNILIKRQGTKNERFLRFYWNKLKIQTEIALLTTYRVNVQINFLTKDMSFYRNKKFRMLKYLLVNLSSNQTQKDFDRFIQASKFSYWLHFDLWHAFKQKVSSAFRMTSDYSQFVLYSKLIRWKQQCSKGKGTDYAQALFNPHSYKSFLNNKYAKVIQSFLRKCLNISNK